MINHMASWLVSKSVHEVRQFDATSTCLFQLRIALFVLCAQLRLPLFPCRYPLVAPLRGCLISAPMPCCVHVLQVLPSLLLAPCAPQRLPHQYGYLLSVAKFTTPIIALSGTSYNPSRKRPSSVLGGVANCTRACMY